MVVVVLAGAVALTAHKSYCGKFPCLSDSGAAAECGRRRRVSINCSIQSAEENAGTEEIRVCTNRSCRKQGSMQTLETITALAPANVAVKSSGCLGRCGAGPNLMALPAASLVGHCGSTARAVEVLVALVQGSNSEVVGRINSNIAAIAAKSLEALALRNKARTEIENNNLDKAELFLSQAIELKPIGGAHIMLKDRSLARLASGNCSGALDDAARSLALNPLYPEAYICQGDAFMAMNQFDSAQKSYLTALHIDPSIRRSKSFKARIANLEKLAAAKVP